MSSKIDNSEKELIKKLGFSPKENAVDVFFKKYQQADNYCIEVDFGKQIINYGKLIKADSKTTQNLSQAENFVVLECVNRLLEKGYKPKHIILEKTYPAGHGTSGRLDICVTRDDGSEYLLIECKTYGIEFDKAFSRLKKDGGQLFTYFKFSNKPDIIMLYASQLKGKEIVYRNEIIKIEDDYRTGDVKDFYEKWNKLTKDNGVWENPPYNFKIEKFIKANLRPLSEEESKTLFHQFATILRKHSVSDKPNAFNVIFNLFLAKLYDEQKRDTDKLDFHWRENDDPVDFQVRLYNLHKAGLLEFLKKEIEGIQDSDFKADTAEDLKKAKKKVLKFNKVFDIKSVLDDDSFEQNHRVLKEVVQLLEKYQIRYPRKQRHLSEFFELLLTTGLKQEAGQYFTPPPVTKFIVKSLPLQAMIEREVNNEVPKLPATIDYAAGSGHFITEILEEYQDIIDKLDTSDYFPKAKSTIKAWSKDGDPYSWAAAYIYGIEKDYRLVKVAKVGCYFYGDGLAQIVHGDGLDSFSTSKSYVGLLTENTNLEDSSKAKFSVVVSNPPYSVDGCKDDLEYTGSQKEFTLYSYLTDKSKEVECLFVERTKQLLKDGGVAGIILPSSILSNEGIYTKSREIILQYFEIIAITELGSNTFMATGTNTVVLFLRRRNNYDSINLKKSVEQFFDDLKDVTRNGIEKPAAKYVNHVWDNISFSDYITLLKKKPNIAVTNHEIYKEYRKKIKAKTEENFWTALIEVEKEKLYYFILAYQQKVVLVKTGDKDAEKRFLGYEFSNRRGNEGIHPIQAGKTIDECTKLFDDASFDNSEKASTYIYKAFSGDYDYPIHDSLKTNIFRTRLVDMLTFDRSSFEKNISTVVKKKVKIESKWDIAKIGKIASTQYGFTDKAINRGEIRYLRITDLNDDGSINLNNEIKYINPSKETKEQFLLKNNDIVIARSGSVGKSAIYKSNKYDKMIFASYLIRLQVDENQIIPEYLFYFTKTQMYWEQVEANSIAVTQPNLNAEKIKEFWIPLPPKPIQEKIVAEIEVLENKELEARKKAEVKKNEIENICLQEHSSFNKEKLINLAITNPSKAEISDLNINTNISFVDMPSVSNNGYIRIKTNRLYGDVKKGSYTYFKEGDIIIAKITPCMENGKCALAVNLTNGIALGSSEFHVIRANNKKINTKYLFTLLNRETVRVEAEKNMTGASGHRRVPISFYEQLEIPLPPLPEQEKIVTKIEKLETEIAVLKQQLDEIPQQKEAILKKYL